jgi:hypothetical protein
MLDASTVAKRRARKAKNQARWRRNADEGAQVCPVRVSRNLLDWLIDDVHWVSESLAGNRHEIGKAIADYALDHGPPTDTIDIGGNKRGFQWVITGQSPAAIVPLSGALIAVPSHQQICTASLVASTTKAVSGIVRLDNRRLARWNGTC